MSTPEEIKAEYASSLADLTFNSKPLINVLTMLADENSPNAKVIVEAIETHLSKVSTDVKLPILYLIDCIVKNVGGTYTSLFSQNIVSTFCGVFKAVDEKTRAEMFKLRQTWNEVFPQMKLYAIDVQINLLDPAWPVTAQPPSNSIHFNPKFLKKTTSPKPKSEPEPPKIVGTVQPNINKETLLMQEQLIQKQKELLELQQKKLELEVLQTQVKLQEQIKHNPAVPGKSILLKPEVAKQLVPSLGKNRPVGIGVATATQQQRLQVTNNSTRINPVNRDLIDAASRPLIRDPRLLRQQQKSSNNNSGVQLGQRTAFLENNKIVTNKVGGRKTRTDPRLLNKDDVPPQKTDTTKPANLPKSHKSHKTSRAGSRSTDSDSSSLKSSSSGSLDSPSKSKSDTVKSAAKHRKKERSDEKKLSPTKEPKHKSEISSFKGVKSTVKNRNSVRRHIGSPTPDVPQDEDLRSFGPPEKQPRLQCEPPEEKNSNVVSTSKGLDVDFRHLPPPAIITKKRTSSEASPDQHSAKKSKSEVFDKLFGDEDTDLRQLPITAEHQPVTSTEQQQPVITEQRPPTPPPPIISSSESPTDSPKSESPKSNLDAIRAKLANATNRDKILSKSFNKKRLRALEDQDLRVPKVSSTTDSPRKIIISPEDEKIIKLGNLTKEQENLLLNKIIMQMEKNKLKEAKKKDKEESFNISLQPISDEEFISSDEEKGRVDKGQQEKSEPDLKPEPNKMKPIAEESLIPFNDKDERLNVGPMPPQGDFMPGPFFPRDGREMRRFPGPPNWRGARGSRRFWENPPRMPVRPWNQPAPWRNLPPHQQQRDYPPQQFPQPTDFPPAPEEELPVSSDIEPKDHLPSGVVNEDEIKTIVIDGVPKDIRFYGELGITFISWDDPRELTFQDDGVRQITFNDKECYVFALNHPYKEVLINGSLHKVKIGAPSREIFIDQVPYECFFGSVIRIDLNGVSTTLKLEGPPPPVKIGDTKRTDLVAGKINVCIDAKVVVPVFLDAKVQKFVLEGETHTLKFVNALETVLINDVPFNVEYGGLPKPIVINGKKHFIRFSVLPKGIKPGRVNIRDMEGKGNISPKFDENSQDSNPDIDAYDPALPIMGKITISKGADSPDRNSNSPNFYRNLLQQQSLNNLERLSNAMTPTLAPLPTAGAYQVENQSNLDVPKNETTTSKPTPVININDLFQKLVASGFVTSTDQKKPTVSQELMKENPPSLNKETPVEKPIVKPISGPTVSKLKRNTCENLRPITFEKPESLRIRQNVLYLTLYSGMQCSSCGMRFSPEASMQYSQHLDWHFRQNRRGKRNYRVANSRRWYYSLSDWKNYEELEDLEEREKNYFDQQQQQADNVGEEAEEDTVIPSVSADPESTDECCDVCRDKFDQFFNEEKEEWHLRNAIRIEDKTYHPLCYEDYQQSLLDQTGDESKIQSPEPAKQEETTIPGLEIIIDVDDEDEDNNEVDTEPTEVVSLESDESKQVEDENDKTEKLPEEGEDDDDDDDVILNEVAPIKIVVDDDDEEMGEDSIESETKGIVKVKRESLDDGFVEVSGLVSLQNGKQIKIKAEPVDLDDVPPVSVSEETPIVVSEKSPEEEPEEQPEEQLKEIPLSQTELLTTMDGNMELLSNTSSVPTSGISCNKIKINISKPLPVINKEKESVVESETPSETYIDPFEPFPPGEEPEAAALKPALKSVRLTKLPPVRKGHELTGLCSIM
ncbi:pcf11 cleavage and polyadenylation factor subunit isoform X2 [Leptinotarsa decemlineata]|uniref:pcf11 cleavage and polyadenylation factor subunit isoform X2 n=1 Tax=Leptinotarsa decemlineata TaxID=7539 RepID=UPI003D303EBF